MLVDGGWSSRRAADVEDRQQRAPGSRRVVGAAAAAAATATAASSLPTRLISLLGMLGIWSHDRAAPLHYLPERSANLSPWEGTTRHDRTACGLCRQHDLAAGHCGTVQPSCITHYTRDRHTYIHTDIHTSPAPRPYLQARLSRASCGCRHGERERERECVCV